MRALLLAATLLLLRAPAIECRKGKGKAAAAADELSAELERLRAATNPAAKIRDLKAAIAAAGCEKQPAAGALARQLRKPCGRALTALGFALESSSGDEQAAARM